MDKEKTIKVLENTIKMHEETLEKCDDPNIKVEIGQIIDGIRLDIDAIKRGVCNHNEYGGNGPIIPPEPALSNRFLVTFPPEFGINPEDVFYFAPNSSSFIVSIRDRYGISYNNLKNMLEDVDKKYDIILSTLTPNNETFRTRTFKGCKLLNIDEDCYSYENDDPHLFILDFLFDKELVEECHNQ